jgi:hypothetical protein
MTEIAPPLRFTRASLDILTQDDVEALRLGERMFRDKARARAQEIGPGVGFEISHEDNRHTIVATFHPINPNP